MKATTPKGRVVKVYDLHSVGTCGASGRLAYGDVPVGCWCNVGSGMQSLEEALVQADEKIDRCGLHE